MLLLLKFGTVRSNEIRTFCTILQTQNTTTASLYQDIVVWLERDTATGVSLLKLLDLNKDNDDLFDVLDRFPIDPDHMWDADNDEIGDASDIIEAR